MTVTQDTIPAQWLRAMQRAADNNLKAYRVNATTYTVRSISHPGTGHLIGVSLAGKVTSCDCVGAQHGRICQHQGAVARRLMRERAITIRQPASEPVQAVESGCRGKIQIFQEEVA
jgi:hypothetical protein